MIHRAPFGSLERFVAVLIEHCAGNFPLWLTPEQAVILSISDKYNEYAKKVFDVLKISDIRAAIDDRDERAGKKIREAEMKKFPFMLIVGEKEEQAGQVSVRRHGGEDLGAMSLSDFSSLVNMEVEKQLGQSLTNL
jgi:threonyl-tRNA synthetase